MNIPTIKALCDYHGIKPLKQLGQNFLIDAEVTRKMIEAAELNAEDLVVEVGPGFGALTRELVKRVKKVVAVEVDRRMVEALREIGSPDVRRSNLQIVHGDILKISNFQFLISNEGYKVVASLPYSITSAALRKFTEQEPRPSLVVVLVQKEVAERVCAKPGQMSVLSVAIQYYGRPEVVAVVPRSAFWPEPEVDSAILRITPSSSPPYLKGEKIGIDEKRLFQLVRIGFSSRRKQLQNNLSAGLRLPRERVFEALKQVGLDPKVRSQELSVENWVDLTQILTRTTP